MIVSNGQSNIETAHKLGCNNAPQFSWGFKQQFGLPPNRAAEIS
jgi:hypothetical protein